MEAEVARRGFQQSSFKMVRLPKQFFSFTGLFFSSACNLSRILGVEQPSCENKAISTAEQKSDRSLGPSVGFLGLP